MANAVVNTNKPLPRDERIYFLSLISSHPCTPIASFASYTYGTLNLYLVLPLMCKSIIIFLAHSLKERDMLPNFKTKLAYLLPIQLQAVKQKITMFLKITNIFRNASECTSYLNVLFLVVQRELHIDKTRWTLHLIKIIHKSEQLNI